MANPDPRREESRLQIKYDLATRKQLEALAVRLRKRIERMGSSFSQDIRKAQLGLVLKQLESMIAGTWTGPLTDVIQAGRKDATQAAEMVAETLTAPLYASLPEPVADALTDGLRAQAASGIESMFARVPRDLSERVWSSSNLVKEKLNELINDGLASGLSAREMARDVYQYASPSTPGGASYAAMRLARTEINNAFHERQRQAANRPGVKAVVWNLSGSHVVPDECNVYAAKRRYEPGEVPDKPHPQCFCYLTYETMSPANFKKELAAGSFDDEIDRRTKANLRRLGYIVG